MSEPGMTSSHTKGVSQRIRDLEAQETRFRQELGRVAESEMPAPAPAPSDRSEPATMPKCGSSSIGYVTDHASSPTESGEHSNSWSSSAPYLAGGGDMGSKKVGSGAAAKTCKKCARDFGGSWRKKHVCRFCGDAFCTYCAQCRVGLFDADGKLKQARVCDPCALYHNIGVAPGFAASPQHTLSARTITPRLSLSATTTTPHTARESQRERERVRELQAEVERLKDVMSTMADQDYLGKKACNLERDKITRRKRLFARNDHHRSKCQICYTQYSLLRREHHCRSCYRSVCDTCSKARIDSQRHCDWCMSAPPAVLPNCATGPLAASRAAEYQHAADLLWKLSQQEDAEYKDETTTIETLQRCATGGSFSNFSVHDSLA